MVLSKQVYEGEKLQLELMDKFSYEFKDSLNSIIGFSEIIKSNCKNKEQIKLISNVLMSSERLLNFVNNMSDFSKSVSENYQKTSHVFSLRALSCEILSSFDSIIKKKELNLQSNIPDLKIKNDHGVTSQVLYSIFDHIIKIAPQNGAIFINSSQIDAEIIFEIKTDLTVLNSKNKKEEVFDFSENNTNLCANMNLFLVKNLLKIINGKILLGKDPNGFALVKLCIQNEI